MTHYMELLAVNQPWNLIMFMAIPVILAETVAITELWILFTRNTKNVIKKINRTAGILGGLYFIGVFIYLLFTAFIPITSGGLWRGPFDFIAVFFYLLGVIPLGGIALIDLGLIFKNDNENSKLKKHAIFVGIFLVTAHIAMIFGMLNPEISGYQSIPLVNEMPMTMEH